MLKDKIIKIIIFKALPFVLFIKLIDYSIDWEIMMLTNGAFDASNILQGAVHWGTFFCYLFGILLLLIGVGSVFCLFMIVDILLGSIGRNTIYSKLLRLNDKLIKDKHIKLKLTGIDHKYLINCINNKTLAHHKETLVSILNATNSDELQQYKNDLSNLLVDVDFKNAVLSPFEQLRHGAEDSFWWGFSIISILVFISLLIINFHFFQGYMYLGLAALTFIAVFVSVIRKWTFLTIKDSYIGVAMLLLTFTLILFATGIAILSVEHYVLNTILIRSGIIVPYDIGNKVILKSTNINGLLLNKCGYYNNGNLCYQIESNSIISLVNYGTIYENKDKSYITPTINSGKHLMDVSNQQVEFIRKIN